MKKKPLSQTNRHIRHKRRGRAALVRTVISSSAVEGIRVPAEEFVAKPTRPIKVTRTVASPRSRA